MSRNRFWLLYNGVSGIYKITNKKTGECYIGASCNIGRRWVQHLSCSTLPIQEDIQVQGPENFTFEIVERVEVSRLGEREEYWIEKLKPFYNKTENSSYPSKPVSLETRKRHSEINRTRTYYKDPGYLKRQSEAQKGKEISKETREKISLSTKGKPKSEETRSRMAKRYRFLTEEGEVVELTNCIASRFMNQGRKLTRLD